MIMNDENDDNKELLRCLRTDVEEVEKDMNLKRKAKVPVVLKTFSLSLCAAVLLIVTLILTFSFVVNKYVKTFENPQVKILSDGMRADLDSVLILFLYYVLYLIILLFLSWRLKLKVQFLLMRITVLLCMKKMQIR